MSFHIKKKITKGKKTKSKSNKYIWDYCDIGNHKS